MKILLLSLMMLVSGESVMARASLATRVAESTKALAFSVALLTVPLVGFAANSSLDDVVQRGADSDFDGEFFRLGIVGALNGAGLMLNGSVQDYPNSDLVTAGAHGFDVDVRYLARKGAATRLTNLISLAGLEVNGWLVYGLDTFGFTQEKVAPLLFIGADMGFHDLGIDNGNRWWVGPNAGAGLEVLDDFLGQGQYTSVQLRAGAGWLMHDQFYRDTEQGERIYRPLHRASRASYDRTYAHVEDTLGDIDIVGTLKLIVKTDGLTVGDVLDKEHGSLWHWLPLVPKGKAVATLHQPVFDDNEKHSGDMIYSLQAQVGLTRHLYLILEHYDSHNFADSYQKAILRLHLHGTP